MILTIKAQCVDAAQSIFLFLFIILWQKNTKKCDTRHLLSHGITQLFLNIKVTKQATQCFYVCWQINLFDEFCTHMFWCQQLL